MEDEEQWGSRYDRQLGHIVAPGGRVRRMLAQYRRWDDRELMKLTIRLARACKSEPGKVSPYVGALVVKDRKLLGCAYRGVLKPGEHAEYTLLDKVLAVPEVTLAGATLFTTLEPCTSRNPPKRPCAERIAARRITRVVIGMPDPNPDILGRGMKLLRERGVEVCLYDTDLVPQIEDLNREFIRQHS